MRVAAVAGSTKLTCVELASPDRLASGRALGEVAVGVPPPMPQMLVGTGRGGPAGLGDGARWRYIAACPSGGQSPDMKERLIKARAQMAKELVPSAPLRARSVTCGRM